MGALTWDASSDEIELTAALSEYATAVAYRDPETFPPDWDGIGYAYALGYSSRNDATLCAGDSADSDQSAADLADALRSSWERWRDHERTARYLRMFWDVAACDYSTSIDRDAVVWVLVTREQVTRWGCDFSDATSLASQALELMRWHCEGDVWTVTVDMLTTGASDSLSGVYDGTSDLRHISETARELAAGMMLSELRERAAQTWDNIASELLELSQFWDASRVTELMPAGPDGALGYPRSWGDLRSVLSEVLAARDDLRGLLEPDQPVARDDVRELLASWADTQTAGTLVGTLEQHRAIAAYVAQLEHAAGVTA